MTTKEDNKFRVLEEKNRMLSENEEKCKAYINLSSEGIWRCELEQAFIVHTSIPVEEQIELIFEKAVMVECNETMAGMYGLKKEEILGLWVKDLLIKTKQENIEYLKAFIENGYKLFDAESIEKDSKGNTKYFLNNLIGIVKEEKLIGGWGTQRDITNIKKAEEALMKMNLDLTKKNEELLRINNELDNFIYTVTHDLNSPLSNIEGLINVLKLNPCANDQEAGMLIGLMEVAVGKFKDAIKNIAQLTSTHTGRTEKEFTDFHEVLENVKFSIGNIISETDTVIKENFSELPSVACSRISIQSILFNLISNAIKYRHPDRRPEIFVRTIPEDYGEFIIEVKDNGIGFSKSKGEDIFELFTRLHDHVEGSGIGLYIVKRIAENSGGRVVVESQPGLGSVFQVHIKSRKNDSGT